MDRNRLALLQILWRGHAFAQRGTRGVLHKDRLNRRPPVGKVSRKNVQGQHNHRQVRSGDFDEQLIVTHLHFTDLSAIDDRREGQRLVGRVSQDRDTARSSQNSSIFQSLGMDHEHLRQGHHGLHSQGGKPSLTGLHQFIGHREGNLGELVDTDRNCFSFMAEDLGQFFLCLNQLGQPLRRHLIAPGCAGSHVWADLFHPRLYHDCCFGLCLPRQEGILRNLPLLLDPNLPCDPLATPQIRSIAVL